MAFQYLGIKKRGTTDNIATRLKVSSNDIDDLKVNKIRYLTNEKTGDILKYDTTESPLLLREFGVKRINNKLIIGGTIKKDFIVSKNPIPLDKKITGRIYAKFNAIWKSSGNNYIKDIYLNVDKQVLTNEANVEVIMTNLFLDQHPDIRNGIHYGEIDLELLELKFITKNEISLEFDDIRLRGVPLNISRIYGENVELNDNNDNNCVKNVLLKNYTKITTKKINKLGDENGITPNELKLFCIDYNIKMIIFDINGNIKAQHIPLKKNKSYKSLIGIAYNNHFYPLKNKELYRVPKSDNIKPIFTLNLEEKIIELLKNKDYPNNIGLFQQEVITVQIGDIIYHKNEDYDTCLDILTSLGLKDKMTFHINKKNISKVIEKLFIKSSIDSFFPYSSNEGGYSYVNNDFVDDKDTITIDHNKHYSDALRKLKNLITIDIKTAKYIYRPTELLENYFYIAKPKYSSILMVKTGFYSYDFLKYCKKEKVEFELLEAISCDHKENYLTDMINTLYKKLSSDNFKFVVNCMIGSFEKKTDDKQVEKFIKIANEDETKTTDKFIRELNDEYNIIYDIEDFKDPKIYNRVPIRVQVLCEARKIVYEKVKELKLTRTDIKQIRTDAITFKYEKKFKGGAIMGEWKQQKPTLYKHTSEIYDCPLTFELDHINQKNTIYIDYAGSGKTYHIINKLVSTLDDYIVLSPSHASIKDYKKAGINCSVIQKYTLSNTIPTEKNIIIDEIGMVDNLGNNMVVKCALMKKIIYSFGDFKQLKPVNGDPCNSEIYLKYLYKNIKKLGTNFRNKFSFEYYDKLCEMTNITEIGTEIKKYNSKNYFEAETIITYTNKTRQKYNELMIQKLKIKFGDVGCKIVCIDNDLKDKNIYNNFYYTIKNVVDDTITITDGVDDIIISVDELKKHFDLGYCRTLYNIQGESLSSFYFTMEDLYFIDGRALYTLISRLKGDIKEI
jgi:hypothetical protein